MLVGGGSLRAESDVSVLRLGPELARTRGVILLGGGTAAVGSEVLMLELGSGPARTSVCRGGYDGELVGEVWMLELGLDLPEPWLKGVLKLEKCDLPEVD